MERVLEASVALVLATMAGTSSASPRSPIANDSCADVTPRDRSPEPAACFDGTPHTSMCVTVERGVRLQVLDWGGRNERDTMVLLTGYGDNAHVYDGFAYQFTDRFHVIGITRRGFLPSSQPEQGYDVATRAHDDIEVLKHLGIRRATFVGHSLAGSELSELGSKYKSHVERLVYLDAFDLATRFQIPDIPPAPYKAGRDDASLQSLQAAQARLEGSLRPDWSVCPGLRFDARGAVEGSTTPAWVGAGIFTGIAEANNPPVDWANIDAPRLGLFNRPTVEAKVSYYDYLSPEDRRTFDTHWPGLVRWYAARIDEFQRPRAGKPAPVVHTVPDAPHYFFISDQAFVVRRMLEFFDIDPSD